MKIGKINERLEIVATGTSEELATAVRESGLRYDAETLGHVCCDMTYPGRTLAPVEGETPSQTLVCYLADASLEMAFQARQARRIREQAHQAPVITTGVIAIGRDARRFVDLLAVGEKAAEKHE
ncbi:MAG: hypothetical protein GX335_09700 [Firmicutes bacterium]|nr:hypothetical protein [Bacillota bacterium]